MNIPDFEKLIQQLADQVGKSKARSLERYLEQGAPEEWIEAQRSLGGLRVLEELRRRVRSADPSTPDWVRPYIAPSPVDLRQNPLPNENGTLFPEVSARFKRRKA